MNLILLIFISSYCFQAAHSNDRSKRQLGGYRFPGPRTELEDNPKARVVKREPQYEERPEYRSSASGYRSQAAQPSSYGSSQSYGYPPSKPEYDSESRREAEKEEKEEEKKPSRLELLLAESKFSCGSKKDGYYADLSVGCQVFHYCVAGVKHSWQCPEQTVFHQVHLNCVPASQDICSQSEKFFVVNDYLHKEMDHRGPNNTVRYHQRFYPEEFLGDSALNAPQSWPPQAAPARQTYPSRPSSSQAYPDDDGYTSPRGSSQPSSYQSYPSQSYPSREQEVPPYRPTARPTAAPSSYSRPDTSYPAPATYSRPSYPSPASSSYQPARPAARYTPASYSAPSSYTSSPPGYSSSPSSAYSSSGSSSSYQPLSSRASSTIPSSYQPLSAPPSSYSRPAPSPYKKVAVTPLPRTVPSYPSSYNLATSKPYRSVLYGAGSSGRSMTSSLFAPDVTGMKSGVVYEPDF